MTEYAVDYAWTHPTPAQLAALAGKGVTTAMRYLSGGTSKDLTSREAGALHDAGMAIGLVWETTATRATAGSAGGKADARAANTQADRLGYPTDCPIFYAVDFDGAWPQVAGYFAGIASVGGRPVGIYGSASIVRAGHAAGIPWLWQTAAWSHGVIVAEAHLHQRVGSQIGVPAGCDENVIQHPFPRWEPIMPLTPADLSAVAAAVLDVPIPRAGDGATGTTTLRTTVAWLDSHLGKIEGNVDPARVSAAVKAALAGVTGGTIDAQAIADQVIASLAQRIQS